MLPGGQLPQIARLWRSARSCLPPLSCNKAVRAAKFANILRLSHLAVCPSVLRSLLSRAQPPISVQGGARMITLGLRFSTNYLHRSRCLGSKRPKPYTRSTIRQVFVCLQTYTLVTPPMPPKNSITSMESSSVSAVHAPGRNMSWKYVGHEVVLREVELRLERTTSRAPCHARCVINIFSTQTTCGKGCAIFNAICLREDNRRSFDRLRNRLIETC